MDQMLPLPDKVQTRRRMGLAARVLGLIVAFVVIADIAVIVPLVVNFRNAWLANRLAAAYTAALVLDAAPDGPTPDVLKMSLLDSVGARMIVLKARDSRRMLAVADIPPAIDEMDDLRRPSFPQSVTATLRTLLAQPGRILDFRGAAPMGAEYVEIAIDEAPFQAALTRYSLNIILLSLAISLFAAALAVMALHVTVLAPVRRLTGSLMRFAENPTDVGRIIVPSGRTHEIGQAEYALADMQHSLVRELREKKRLAELGLAVAKINHDLRNMLGAAQLLSDRLVSVADPIVARNAPKLVSTLDRAIHFCQTVLAYGRSVDETPHLARVDLRPIAQEALETAIAGARSPIEPHLEVTSPLMADVDAEQMFRILNNLCRNAVEALDGARANDEPLARASILVAGHVEDGFLVMRVSDTGPGLSKLARENLFVAFQGAARAGGTGLGLAIAADLVRGHGGTLAVLDGADANWPGARFEIRLPLGATAGP